MSEDFRRLLVCGLRCIRIRATLLSIVKRPELLYLDIAISGSNSIISLISLIERKNFLEPMRALRQSLYEEIKRIESYQWNIRLNDGKICFSASLKVGPGCLADVSIRIRIFKEKESAPKFS